MTINQLLPILFVVLLIAVSIAGNFLIVISLWRKRSLRSTTNYLLLNVAIADIINLIFLPLMFISKYVAALEKGFFADFLCKFVISYHIPLTASIVSTLTLTVLAVERYHAVVKPMNTWIRLRKGTVKYAIVSVWLVAVALTSPFYVCAEFRKKRSRNNYACKYTISILSQKIYVLLMLCIAVFIPFFVISFCYFQILRELYFKNKVGPQNLSTEEETREKRKLLSVSLLITVTFVVCFFPLVVTSALSVIDSDRFPEKNRKVASVLYFLESVLNPFLYAFQSTNFREAFKEILLCRHTHHNQ